MEAFFEPSGPDRYRATGHTRGPWSAQYMHAGPPTALLAHASAAMLGRPELRLGRICVEILAPVPVGEVTVCAQVVREGAQVSLVCADLRVADRPVMMARSWFLREHPGLEVPGTPPITPPGQAGEVHPIPPGWGRGYLDAIDWRWVSGGYEEPGAACVWARPLVELLVGVPTSDVERLLSVADSASGISAVANPRDLLFVNTDLTVHLQRAPRGDWLWMSAQTRLYPNGSGVTSGVIGDADGDVARTGQLLFVQRQPTAAGTT